MRAILLNQTNSSSISLEQFEQFCFSIVPFWRWRCKYADALEYWIDHSLEDNFVMVIFAPGSKTAKSTSFVVFSRHPP